MIIRNGLVFQEDRTFAKKDIVIENGRIVRVEKWSEISQKETISRDCIGECDKEKKSVTEDSHEIVDATGRYVLPGLIDIHSHGSVGHDYSDGDAEGLREILAYQYAHGVTSYCPTSMTLPKKKLLEVYRRAGEFVNSKENVSLMKKGIEGCGADLKESRNLARIVGFNMEGPFLDPSQKGAHREEDILMPDVDFFRECNEACGNWIRLVTIAPNVEDAVEFIREITDCRNKNADEQTTVNNIVAENQELAKYDKITISLGHTNADYDTVKNALAAGANHITHLFNAMTPMNHRNPGLIGAAAEDENCMVELICDGVHVHESMVRAAFKLFPGRIVLISDSMRAAGLSDGEYDLGGQQVTVRDNLATLKDGTIAGSVTNLFDCMRKAIEFGISAEEAVAAATMNPAKSIGIYKEVGSLTPGKRADVILVDKDWKLVDVICV